MYMMVVTRRCISPCEVQGWRTESERGAVCCKGREAGGKQTMQCAIALLKVSVSF